MTNAQTNKYSMYLVVLTVLDKFSSLVATVPALVRLVVSFKKMTADIGKTSGSVGVGTTGKTKAKRKAESEMSFAVASLVGSLHAYAADKNNVDLMEKSSVTQSDIEDIRDAERGQYAKSLVDMVESSKAELSDWNVNEAKIADARQKISVYESSLGDRSATKTEQSGGVDALVELFAKADALLKDQIDRLANSFEQDHPDFFSEYEASRVIRDVAASRNNRGKDNPDATGSTGATPSAS